MSVCRGGVCSLKRFRCWAGVNFGEEAAVPIGHMLPQKPAIAKFIVSFNQFDSITLGQVQFIGASSLKVICAKRAELVGKPEEKEDDTSWNDITHG